MDLENINTLAGRFESLEGLSEYCDKQVQMIERLKRENDNLKHEVAALREHLSQKNLPAAVNKPVAVVVTAEENICTIQIEKLQEKASSRELTLEETKRLEILVKSLYLIREKDERGLEAEFRHIPDNMTIESLALIASSGAKPEVE